MNCCCWFNYKLMHWSWAPCVLCYHHFLRHWVWLYIAWFLASYSHCHSHSVRSTQHNFTQDTNAPIDSQYEFNIFSYLFQHLLIRCNDLSYVRTLATQWVLDHETKEIEAKRKTHWIELHDSSDVFVIVVRYDPPVIHIPVHLFLNNKKQKREQKQNVTVVCFGM